MRFILACLLTLLPIMASAQATATLVADTVFVPAGSQQLIAEGNVEVFFEGTRLSARRITFVDKISGITATIESDNSGDMPHRSATGVVMVGTSDKGGFLELALGSEILGGPMTIEGVLKWNAFNRN
jgi:hypothetical protein